MQILIKNIIEQLTEVNNGKLWIGTQSTIERKLKQIDESLVFTRPISGLHSVAELISHLTFWRQEAISTIKTGKGSVTEESKGNWRTNDELIKSGWQKLRTDYDNSLTELVELLQQKEDSFLSEHYDDIDFGGKSTYSYLLNGMLHHDLYHLGQLGITIKFLNKGFTSGGLIG